MWNYIQLCISGYLIKKGYEKSNKNRFESNAVQHIEMEWNEKEYVELRCIGSSSLFRVILIYSFKYEALYAIKKPNLNDDEHPKLNQREIKNYLELNYPFFPKFYETDGNFNSIIVEFINGHTLSDIQQLKLDENNKITIIFELVLAINHLHEKKFVYRDLKPNNVIIDQNKTAVLIDFDRMIKISSNDENDKERTNDFSSKFIAPEINCGKISFKSDIYSLGMLIDYIMNEGESNNDNFLNEIF
ncbi:hypothetical protein M9Y10_016951 [Tritrichomonas musculus]|uniref:Protein kinase domain-containing protein n=1 Tax=Tritrichomonas musculus TaxID=1915356 RepID=A0ABR2HXP2_9EUKA